MTHTLLAIALLLVSPLVSSAAKNHPAVADANSGLTWGVLSYYAGGGTAVVDPSMPFPNGVLANTLQNFSGSPIAVDSQGNLYVGQTVPNSGANLYIIYAGGNQKLPPLLAAVTTGASPAAQPVPGGIYLVAGGQQPNCANGSPTFCQDANTADQATFGAISGIAFDSHDNVYIADSAAAGIRLIANNPNDTSKSTAVTTVAGTLNLQGGPVDDATANTSSVFAPIDLKVDASGNIYFADYDNAVIQVVYVGGTAPILTTQGRSLTQGNIYIVAGVPGVFCTVAGTCGNAGPANAASFDYPNGIDIDSKGNIYVTDQGMETASVIFAGGTPPPILAAILASGGTTAQPGYSYEIAGQEFVACGAGGTPANCGDGAPAPQAYLNAPSYLKVDATGNLYIADTGDITLRKVDQSSYISLSAGTESPQGATGPSIGNGGPATSAMFAGFGGFAIDSENNLYISDGTFIWQVPPVQSQTVTFPALDPVVYGVAPIDLDTAVAVGPNGTPTGLPITYTKISGPGTIAANSNSLVVTGAGQIVIMASQAGSVQFSPASATQTLTVNPAPLVVTADDASKVYQAANPPLTYRITGFVNGDTQATANITGAPAISTTATLNSPAGTYPISIAIGTLAAPNYTFASFVPGALSITGNDPQTITFNPLTPVTYGQTSVITLGATASSALPVTLVVTSGPATLTGTTLKIAGAGTIVITASQEGAGNYKAAAPVSETLIVNPAPLTVTGPAVSLSYGTVVDPTKFPLPVITGFVGSDTAASLTGNAAYATPVTGTTPHAGSTYPVQVTQGTLALLPSIAANYIFNPASFVPGTLTITQATQALTFDTITNLIYGAQETLSAVSITGQTPNNLPVTVNVVGPGGLIVLGNSLSSYVLNPTSTGTTVPLGGIGVGTVTVTVSQAGTADYAAAAPVSQTITVGPAPLNVGLAQIYSREEGDPNPVFQFVVSGFVNGDTDIPAVITGLPLLTTDATQASPPGTYAITPSQGTLVAKNYTFVYVPGELIINPPGGFNITTSPTSLTVASGLSAQATLTLTPLNLFQGTVTLTCGQLPANVTCSISPSTYTFPGNQSPAGVPPNENPAQGTLTIVASATQVVASSNQGRNITIAGFLVPGLLGGLLLFFSRRRYSTSSRVWGVIAVLLLFAGSLGLSSCGSSTKSTVAGSGTTTIMIIGNGTSTASGNVVTATAPFTVTVQ